MRSPDKTAFAGVMVGLISIFGSFTLEGGSIGALIIAPPMIIVFGGTLATALIGSSSTSLKKIVKLIRLAFAPPVFRVREAIEDIVRSAVVARKHGLLSLEKELENMRDPFLKKLMRFAIDGTDPALLRSLAETEVAHLAERHQQGAALFHRMGGYAPTMGIIGTIMGLIATLAAAGEDPNELIRHIATAFVATLWGVFTANILWLPIADKLRTIHAAEQHYREVIIEGVLSIQAGEVPALIRAKLNSMLPSSEQEPV